LILLLQTYDITRHCSIFFVGCFPEDGRKRLNHVEGLPLICISLYPTIVQLLIHLVTVLNFCVNIILIGHSRTQMYKLCNTTVSPYPAYMHVFSYVTNVSFLRRPKPESLLPTHTRTSPANSKFLPSLLVSFCPRPTRKTSTITVFLLSIGLRCAVLLQRCMRSV
jgi:hypothetical protein